MARNYDPQSDPWAVEPTTVKLYRREHVRRPVDTDQEGRQSWRRLVNRLKGQQRPVGAVDSSPSSPTVERDEARMPTSKRAASTTERPSPSVSPKRRILTEQDYQAWLLTQQTILSCDVLGGMRTSPPSSLRSRR